MAEFPAERSGDLIFKGPMGAALRRNNFIDQRVGQNAWQRPDCLRASGSTIWPHRQHVGGLVGGEHTGADASDGAREYALCIDLSARHQQAVSRDRGCD